MSGRPTCDSSSTMTVLSLPSVMRPLLTRSRNTETAATSFCVSPADRSETACFQPRATPWTCCPASRDAATIGDSRVDFPAPPTPSTTQNIGPVPANSITSRCLAHCAPFRSICGFFARNSCDARSSASCDSAPDLSAANRCAREMTVSSSSTCICVVTDQRCLPRTGTSSPKMMRVISPFWRTPCFW